MTTKKNVSASDWASKFGRPATAPTPAGTPVSPDEVEDSVALAKVNSRQSSKKASQRRQKTAPRARQASEAPEQPEPASVAPEAPVVRSRRRAPAKRPVTYRLTDDVLDLVDAAVFAAAEKGERLTKEEAVAVAIRRAYARLVK